MHLLVNRKYLDPNPHPLSIGHHHAYTMQKWSPHCKIGITPSPLCRFLHEWNELGWSMVHLHIGQLTLLFFISSSFFTTTFYTTVRAHGMKKWNPANVASLSCHVLCGLHLQKCSSSFKEPILSEEVRSINPKGCFGPHVSSIQTLL